MVGALILTGVEADCTAGFAGVVGAPAGWLAGATEGQLMGVMTIVMPARRIRANAVLASGP